MDESKIRVEHLTKRFGDMIVLNDLNFKIEKGEFVCVVGPTGCGKTTFLNLLTRIYTPSEGELYIDGQPANPKKHNISFAFQEPSAMPWLNVRKNLEFGMKIKRVPRAEMNRRIDRILRLLGLEETQRSYPRELSVSSEQRVIIGRAFSTYPDLFLMDEPYGQMDIKMRFYLEDEILKLWKEFNSTVLFITHNIEEAVYLAEKVIILSNKPTVIKEVVTVNLPYPRDVLSEEFVKLRKYITSQIKWW